MMKQIVMFAWLMAMSLGSVKAQDVKVEFFTPSIVHVVKDEPTKTLVITAKPEHVPVTHTGNTWKSSELTVKLEPETQTLVFMTNKGKVLLREKGISMVRKNTGEFEVSQSFFLDKDEAIYGLGTIQNGKMNRRGEKKRMEQSNLEDFQNVLQSIKGWGLYWENYSPTLFEDNAEGMSFTSEAGQGIDYYFMYGGSADGVIAQMRHLTGDVPMFPLWTYGYWQSKERYKTAAETESIVDQYRALQVPLDGIIQDWQYWGSNYLWNAMDFLSEDFATGPQLIKNVHAKHAHFMISIWASFGPQTQQFRELNEKGLLMPFETWPQSGISHIWPPVMKYPSGVKVYDAFSPEARAIYWKYLKTLYDYGCDAWWMDSTDPDFFNPRESDYAHKVYGGTWRSQRNAFPLETVRGIYQAQRKEANSQKRIFIMTRSSFAGQQHYGSNMWSGDVNSSWDMLRKQVPAGLSFSLTGNPNFNTDIGGFFCGSYNTQGPASAPKNPQFQELYVRWMQYGLFCPVFRSHGADAPREIWQFGKKGEPVYDAIEKMIRLRYRLLPYLYSTAWQVTSNNDSYMRPLFSDFASDKKVWNMTDEFMFGRCILAAPIVDPQYTEEKIIRTDAMTGWDRKSVSDGSPVGTIDFTATKTAVKYLPKGATWYDFWTNKAYKGGRNVTLETTFDRVPMFVRAGSILPLGPEMQYVGEKAWDNLELRVYPGADGRFVLYEDEGDNYNYEKGAYSTITLQWNDKKHTLTIGARKGSYPGMLSERAFTIVWPDGTSKTVNYQGQEINISK
jgi:alpha-D-xyloside xylohydrolase